MLLATGCRRETHKISVPTDTDSSLFETVVLFHEALPDQHDAGVRVCDSHAASAVLDAR